MTDENVKEVQKEEELSNTGSDETCGGEGDPKEGEAIRKALVREVSIVRAQTLANIKDFANYPAPSRPVSIAVTKFQEAAMFLEEELFNLGVENLNLKRDMEELQKAIEEITEQED